MEFHPHTKDTSIVSGEIWDARRRRGAVVTPMIEVMGGMIGPGRIYVVVIAAATESGCTWWFGAGSRLPSHFSPFGEKMWL